MKRLSLLLWLGLMGLLGSMPNARAGETVTLVMTDAQGTPVVETDIHGTVLARYAYRPYGTSVGGPLPAGPGYTGHVNDPDTGLVYMQQRYYDPETGRFQSVDPVGPVPGNVFNLGRYTYASNNPIANIDPDGQHDKPVIVTLPNGNKIIYLPVRLTGNSSQRRILAMTAAQTKAQQIASGNGKLSVVVENADVVKATHPITFDISSGKQSMGNEQGEGINTNTMQGHLDGSRSDIGSTIVHDSLHPLGVKDDYRYQVDSKGNVLHAPNGDPIVVSDPKNTNIMGPNLGNTFNYSQINNEPKFRSSNVGVCQAIDNTGGGCQ